MTSQRCWRATQLRPAGSSCASGSVSFRQRDSVVVYVTRVFFFSSRRRHTRCSRDWSSDVCSSDLAQGFTVIEEYATGGGKSVDLYAVRGEQLLAVEVETGRSDIMANVTKCAGLRSEERRVGKECRSRWSPYH